MTMIKPGMPFSRRHLLTSTVALLLGRRLLRGQQPPTVAVQVDVVNVLATVRDKHGKIINDLTQSDFELEDNGRPQPIVYFSRETDLPLTLGLLVDTSLSQRRVLDQEREASHVFLGEVLRVDKDQAFVIHFDREVELLQDLTPSTQKLNAALDLLQTPERGQRGGSPDDGQGGSGNGPGSGRGGGRRGGGGGRRGGGGGGGTQLYDAVYLASNEITKNQKGRKAVIVLSDGVDRGSKVTETSAIQAAEAADTLVYSILFKDEQGYGNRGFGGPGMGGMGRRGGRYPRYPEETRPDGKKILEQISKQTGGRLFEVSKKQPIDQIFAQIQEELRNQYNLGFSPVKTAGAGYHTIKLTTTKRDLVVQAREGYYKAG